MGKKRSNRKKRKTKGANALKNPCDEKKTSSVSNSKLEEGKDSCKSHTSVGAQNTVSHKTGKIKTHSCEGNLQNAYASYNYNANLSTDKSSKICSTSSVKPKNYNKNLSQGYKEESVVFTPNEISEPVLNDVYPACRENSSLSENEEETTNFPTKKSGSIELKSNFYDEMPNSLIEDYNDKLFLHEYLGEENSESDDDVSYDFFQPVFDEWRNSKDSERKDLRGENLYGAVMKNSYFEENGFSSEASPSVGRNLRKYDFEGKIKLKETFSSSVDAYKNSKDSFSDVYHTWLPERRSTLQKLRTLLSEVHNDQLNYNKSQAACREFGMVARNAKCGENQAINFLASVASFLTDAASGVVSLGQAFNIDTYQNKFQEIMEQDAEITQRLYKARSLCTKEYHNVEEVMRNFHPDTFSTTVGKISDSLEIDKYWKDMKYAYGKDDMPQLANVVSRFFDNAFQSTKLDEVKESIESYVDDNPAALEACKSAGRATYGAFDTLKVNHSKNSVLRGISSTTNLMLMAADKNEVDRLKSVISEDTPQSKLESQIEDAVDSLESEMKEINNIYFELFKIYTDSDDSECDVFALY